jgi:hypothetical protein
MLAAMSGGALALENSVFLYIGALHVRLASMQRWTKTDYIVAVNLCSLGVFLIYIAWHENAERWDMTKEECAELAMDPIEYERFKPLNDCNWACLPGFEHGVWPFTGRRVVAKVADNVHEWELGKLSAPFAVGPALLSSDSLPVLERIVPDNQFESDRQERDVDG